MRKLGMLLAFLGGFLLMLALLAQFYAPGQLMRTPTDVDTTTHLAGEATLGGETFPVKATSVTKTDSDKSTDDTVVWVNSTCLVKDQGDVPDCVSADDPEKRLISASTDNFATDRTTAMAVNDPALLPADAEEKDGLVNKWPFQAEKKTYPYWDATVGDAVDAEYVRTEKVDGLEAYVYEIVVTDFPTDVAPGVPGTYSTTKKIWVEPLTGSILRQTEHRVMVEKDGAPFLDLDLDFTPEQVETNVEDAKTNVDSLNLIRKVVPLVGLLLGLPLLVLGLVLVVFGRRRTRSSDAVD